MTHGLSGRSREACDVGEDGLRHVLPDIASRLLLFVTADLPDKDDQLRLRIRFEPLEDVDERRADDRVATDADDGRVSKSQPRELVADLIRERPRSRNEADRARGEDLCRDDSDVRL